MGMTISQKIIAAHAELDYVETGQIVLANIDLALANDATLPIAIDEFNRLGVKNIFDANRVALVMDHFSPNKDIKAASQCKKCREFSNTHEIVNFFEGGNCGIEHVLLPEKGIITGGDLVIGSDSHTCTYGALGSFSTGVGSTDLAVAVATGKVWLRVPKSILFEFQGKFNKYASAKDLILHIIGKIGVDGALYKSMEFVGDGVHNLTISDRLCVCNMAIEAGGKNGIFAVDDKTIDFLKEADAKEPKVYYSDFDASFDARYEIRLDEIEPTVAFPHLPSNTKTFNEIKDIKIDQVVIGSCTNGRLQDLEEAASILKGKKISKGLRVFIFPGTPKIWRQAMHLGLWDIFLDSGAVISPPTCGPCLGGHMGILAANERAVSTTNRNFVGRMGDPKSEVYLASPFVAAASAVTGKISHPREVE